MAVLAGAAAPAARADACPADARASYARVQLFKDSACSGASVSVGFTGSGDRPDFAAFTNYEGAVYDIDDTRDSVAIAPATCIRLFDGKRFTGVDSGLLCAPQTTDGLFASLGALTNRVSSMRVCPASAPSGCNAVAAPPPPPPLPNGSPATPDARLAATLAGGRKRRTVGFGRAAVVRARLTDAGGRAIAGAALQVFTREQRAGSEWRVAPAITTDAGGSARLRLAPGPSRTIRIEYRALVGDAQPAAAARARLAVRAGVRLRIRPRQVRAGHSIQLTWKAARRALDAAWQSRDLPGARARALARLQERAHRPPRPLPRALPLLEPSLGLVPDPRGRPRGRLVSVRDGPLARGPRARSLVLGAHRVELDPVHERVLVDRPRVRGAVAQGLAVGLAGAPDVLLGDRRERDEVDGVDLDLTEPDPVTAALLDLWPLPQPDRQRDVAAQDVVAQLAAELHAPDASVRSAAGAGRRPGPG